MAGFLVTTTMEVEEAPILAVEAVTLAVSLVYVSI